MLQDHKLVNDEYIPELQPELICREAGFARNSVCVTDTQGIIRESYLNRGGTTIIRPLFRF